MNIITVSAIDFNEHRDYSAIFTTIGWVCGAIIIIALFITIFYKETAWFVIGMIGCVPVALFIMLMGGLFFMSPSITKSQIQEFQLWSADTYLLDVTYDEAKIIMLHQRDITGDDTPEDKLKTQTLFPAKTIYGEKVEAGLIKNGDDWEMIVVGDITMRVPDKTDTATVK